MKMMMMIMITTTQKMTKIKTLEFNLQLKSLQTLLKLKEECLIKICCCIRCNNTCYRLHHKQTHGDFQIIKFNHTSISEWIKQNGDFMSTNRFI